MDEHLNLTVVGFPKSGTTWLTRLVQDCFGLELVHAMEGDENFVRRSNDELGQRRTGAGIVRKIHFLHERFQSDDRRPAKFIYVYRDVRDVMVSAFFHVHDHGYEPYLRRSMPITAGDLLRLHDTARRLYWRFRARQAFDAHVDRRSTRWNDAFGDWSGHIRAWLSQREKGLAIAVTSYERLLADAAGEIVRIAGELELTPPETERVAAAVARQSFGERRRALQEGVTRDNNVELATKRASFLRKGQAGDWKNYLTRRAARLLHERHGEMLFRLGYEKDSRWYLALDDAPHR